MHTRTLFAAITILLLLFISAPLAIVQADTPPPGVDTAQRDDVAEDDEGGASGAVDDGSGALRMWTTLSGTTWFRRMRRRFRGRR